MYVIDMCPWFFLTWKFEAFIHKFFVRSYHTILHFFLNFDASRDATKILFQGFQFSWKERTLNKEFEYRNLRRKKSFYRTSSIIKLRILSMKLLLSDTFSALRLHSVCGHVLCQKNLQKIWHWVTWFTLVSLCWLRKSTTHPTDCPLLKSEKEGAR